MERPANEERSSQAETAEDRRDRSRRVQRDREFAHFARLIGPRHAECSFDSFATPTAKHRAAVTTVQKYADDLAGRVKSGSNLILYGPPGTGKDHMLSALIRHGIARGLRVTHPGSGIDPQTKFAGPDRSLVTVSYVTWTSGAMMAEQFRRAMRDEGSTATLLHARVLAISDPALDSEMSDFQSRELYRVIDHRYRHQLPTWVTCNAESTAEFNERLSRQSADRLRHGATAVFCDWPSYRTPGG